MVYEEFISTIQKSLKLRLGDSALVAVQKVPKNNGTMLDGLCVTKPGQQVTPTIYMNSFYDHWQSGVPLSCILDEIVHIYEEGASFSQISPDMLTDFSLLQDKLVYKLVHTHSNRVLLEDLPNVPFLDLSIVFYLYLEEHEYGHMTALIHNSHKNAWGVTTEELYELAKWNTPRLLPAELKSMGEVIRDLYLGERSDSLTRQLLKERLDFNEPTPLYVLSNTSEINGACAILYEHVLKNFADLLGQNLIILPSSIHEVLLLPCTEDLCMEELFQMVYHVNRTEVPVEDRLSDEIYWYQREDDSITSIPRLSKNPC